MATGVGSTMMVTAQPRTASVRERGVLDGVMTALVIFGFGLRKHRRLQVLCLMLIGLMTIGALVGRGTSSNPTTAVVTVTGTSGSVS
jgi:hypothetical protein